MWDYGHETQQSVFAWIDKSYPGATLNRRLMHAFEELVELALQIKPDIEIDRIHQVIDHTVKKVQAQPAGETSHKKELGDFRIAAIGIAGALDIDEQQALDEVMALNRSISLPERQSREAAKQTLKIFKP